MQTVISAYDNRDIARRAAARLVDTGFPPEDVHLQQAPVVDTIGSEPVDHPGMADAEREAATDRYALDAIGHFFTRLFGIGHPQDYQHTYPEAVRRGSSVVVVDVRDEEEADRASQILQDFGAVNVDERAQRWRAEGWSGRYLDELPVGAAAHAASASGLDALQEELRAGKRGIDPGGARVVQREQPPLREIVAKEESIS